MTLTRNERAAVIGAALLALFLGALDALIISAAMPTIVAELGLLSLFSFQGRVIAHFRQTGRPV